MSDDKTNSDFWKNKYKGKWKMSSKREMKFASYFEKMTGFKVKQNGLGTGGSDFISGSAESHGYSKGDADFVVNNTNIFIEVTGPLSNKVSTEAPLWVRPDKIDNAIKNMQTHITFFAHHCPCADLWRVIYVDREFVRRYEQKEFRLVDPIIGGTKELYVEIPYDDDCVHTMDFLQGYFAAYMFIRERGN